MVLLFVHIKINDNKIYIDFHIIVVYGVSIAEVPRGEVYRYDVEKINIYVYSVFENERLLE